ncbi:MAG: hypothetical protein WC846_04860 [Candidatus Gracilibacteria bacterium]
MKKNLRVVLVLLFLFVGACTQKVAPLAEDVVDDDVIVNDEIVSDVEDVTNEQADVPYNNGEKDSYEIHREPFEGGYLNSLFYEKTKLFDFPYPGDIASNAYSTSLAKVFKGEESDIVFVVNSGQCAGCNFFSNKYYVVNKADLSVEAVEFSLPPDVGGYNGEAMNAIFADEVNEMAYVNVKGDFFESNGKLSNSYYEEVWVYLFDTQEWKLVKTIDAGETIMCDGMMSLNIDPTKISYWKEALVISPTLMNKMTYCVGY